MTAAAIILGSFILASALDRFGDKLTKLVSMLCEALKEANKPKNAP